MRFDKNHSLADIFLLQPKSMYLLQIVMEHVPCQSVNLLITVTQTGTPVAKFKESQILHAFLLSPFFFYPDEDYVEKFDLNKSKDEHEFSFVYWHIRMSSGCYLD